jgi:hypothetical protein
MPANIKPLFLSSELTFNSFDQLLCYTQTYAKSAGYAFITDKSKLRKKRQVRYLNYKRASQERCQVNKEHRIRKRFIYKCEC